MTTTIQKWGNSHGVRLPKVILELADMKENDAVQVVVENDSIIIKKPTRKHRAKVSLTQRLEDYYNRPIDEILADDTLYTPQEYDWGEPVGREYW